MQINLRRAHSTDIASIIELYTSAYDGTYPDKSFTDLRLLKNSILENFLFVAEIDTKVVACLKYYYDEVHLLAKAASAVVDINFRGKHLTQELIKFGIEYFEKNTKGVEVVYITTRTVHKAAQILTEQMGFKPLGIFPNVHKTSEYETHALVALYRGNALSFRHSEFKQHPVIAPLFSIAGKECALPAMETDYDFDRKVYKGEVPHLELIEAKHFVEYRVNKLKEMNAIDMAFFPFHQPTCLITSPDQEIEIFCYINEVDNHCVITGVKIDRKVELSGLLKIMSNMLRNKGVRYIELIVRANRLNIIEKFLNARFIPCGYFPAFQLCEGKRYDYVVFSKSFEVLDFSNLELRGVSKDFLQQYVKVWEEIYLGASYASL